MLLNTNKSHPPRNEFALSRPIGKVPPINSHLYTRIYQRSYSRLPRVKGKGIENSLSFCVNFFFHFLSVLSLSSDCWCNDIATAGLLLEAPELSFQHLFCSHICHAYVFDLVFKFVGCISFKMLLWALSRDCKTRCSFFSTNCFPTKQAKCSFTY